MSLLQHCTRRLTAALSRLPGARHAAQHRAADAAAHPPKTPSHRGLSDPISIRPQPARAILHPRTTESGEPMRISLSPRAAHRLSKIATDDNNANTALRVTVESGGCHGFQYLMSLTDLNKEPATEEDTLFEGDRGAKVIIDESSLELLNGSTVDYTMELIGSQFKVTGIPGATSSCGCGTSFDIKL
ncbi:[4Fe-4S] proteins maturation [Didymosphaeria variabile]|uniref:[4Fe-4S] proteins maturation n=1 Tax=Didymosphaeria variabile TaxID=1932322 RepID=A0A9W9C7U5_9PLEO|nr:[4Fe-4S] proteins maturation [Didymosphaeria variabile]KAJ4349850.1 [4Fe-4S] proteins maturation [Didymosphaeria variabile]